MNSEHRAKPRVYYQERLLNQESKLQTLKQLHQKIGTIRLLVFLASAVGFYLAVVNSSWFWLLFALLFVVFLYLVKKHAAVKSKILYQDESINYLNEELAALAGKLDGFDPGLEFLDGNHPYAQDLHIIGNYSLFRTLNRCGLSFSKKHLAEYLTQLPKSAEEIELRQRNLLSLAQMPEWREELVILGKRAKAGSDSEELNSWLEAPDIISKKPIMRAVLWLIPSLAVVLILAWIFNVISANALGVLGLINLGFTSIYVKKINRFHNSVAKKQRGFKRYAVMLQTISAPNFDEEILKSKSSKAAGGAEAFKQLAAYFQMLDSRLNMLMGIVLNALFLWDLNLMLRIENWKNTQGKLLPQWLETIAFFEAQTSLATYIFNHPQFVFPSLNIEDDLLVKTTGLSHPLMLEEQVVANDFSLSANKNLVLLSGANMSGKSTFLRTVGLSVVMAHLGLPVRAKSMIFRPMYVFSSMNITDSLGNNESFFYAELKRLNQMINALPSEPHKLVLLDEILRGTNSNDKHKGSVGLIKKLLALGACGIVATHDIELGKLANEYPENILNKCFEVQNHGGNLVFDYALRDGICKNLNATYLMEKMGII